MKRNGLLELVRFLAAVSIAIYHFEWICIGNPVYFMHFYIWVEFFFIISGFFLAKNASEKETIGTLEYTCRQIKKLYPMYLLAFSVSFIYANIVSKYTFLQWGQNLWKSKWEILLGYVFAFDSTPAYNGGGAPAYIPVLILSSLVLYYCIQKRRELFVAVAPVLSISGIAYIIHTYGHLSVWQQRGMFLSMGLIRGLAEMTFGAFCYLVIFPYMKNIKKIYIYILFLLCIIACVMLSLYQNHITSNELVLWIVIFGILVMTSLLIEIPDRLSIIFCCLGKFSYPIFLLHYVALMITKYTVVNESYVVKLGYASIYICCFVLAILLFEKLKEKILARKKFNVQKK